MITVVNRRIAGVCLAFLALGALGGASVAVVLLGDEVDRLTLDNVALMDEMERLSNRIALLDTYGPTSGVYVESIEITARGVERARPAIEQALKGLLAHLIGEELDRVNAATIQSTLERTIEVDQQEYAVQVRYVYVAPTLRAHVDVQAIGEPNLIE